MSGAALEPLDQISGGFQQVPASSQGSRGSSGRRTIQNSAARRETHLWPQIAARYFSMAVQQPPSPPRRSASPHDAAATTGSPCLKEVSKYNQPLATPTLPLQLSGKIPFCLKLSRCALQLEGSLWEKYEVHWMRCFLKCGAGSWFHFGADPRRSRAATARAWLS